MLGHAELARLITTPICLDESIVVGADRGGRDHARRLPGRQHQARPGRRLPRGAADPRRVRPRTACRCGAAACSRPGSAERPTSALAALPGFTLPGDTSASDRYYRTDITEPFVSTTATSTVPTGPGLGVDADPGDPRAGHDRRSEWITTLTSGPRLSRPMAAATVTSATPAPASAGCSTTSAPRCSSWSTATPSDAGEIGGVVIHDPLDEPVLPAHALVLGVGRRRPPTRSPARCATSAARAPSGSWCARRSRSPPRSGAAVDDVRRRAARPAPWGPVGPAGRAAALAARRGRRRARGAGDARRAARRATCSRWPTRSPRCSTRRSPSRTAARGCWPSPAARTRPTRRASRRSSAGRCRSATRGCSPSAASSGSCYRSDQPVFVEPDRRTAGRLHACRGSRSRSAPATRCSARSGPRWTARLTRRAHRGAAGRRQAGGPAHAAGPRRCRRAAPAAGRPGRAPRWRAASARATR